MAYSARLIFVFLFIALSYHQSFGQNVDLGELLGNGNGGGGLGGLLGEGNNGNDGLLDQLLGQLGQLLGNSSGEENCGLIAGLLGLCGPSKGGQPCCRCCQGGEGVNDLCATIGILDLLFKTNNSCPTGSIVLCTAQACQVGQQCNVQAGNLLCADIVK